MTTVNLFEQASRLKLRFDSKVGKLSAEELWDLPLTSNRQASLDEIAINLNTQLTVANQSFVNETSSKDKELELKFEIVKHVISVRKEENTVKLEAQARAQKRQKLDELIAKKEEGALESLSLEDLQKLRAEV